jgi:hypothetical protein
MSTAVDDYLAHVGVEVDDELKHYGKKGMKWGVRKSAIAKSAGLSRRERKIAKNKEITDARERQRMRGVELERQAFKTYSANGRAAAEAAVRKYDKMAEDLLSNPDAATASKLTSGEKAAAAVNWAIVGGLTAASIGLSLSARS